MIINRRKLIGGIGLLIAAPAIVRIENIMPVKAWADETLYDFKVVWDGLIGEGGRSLSVFIGPSTLYDGVSTLSLRDYNHRKTWTYTAEGITEVEMQKRVASLPPGGPRHIHRSAHYASVDPGNPDTTGLMGFYRGRGRSG